MWRRLSRGLRLVTMAICSCSPALAEVNLQAESGKLPCRPKAYTPKTKASWAHMPIDDWRFPYYLLATSPPKELGVCSKCAFASRPWRLLMNFARGAALLCLFPLVSVMKSAATDWPPISPEELSMTRVPEQPGAPAVVLLREETDDDMNHVHSVSERIKI